MLKKLLVSDLDLKNKRILIRVDFNVPLDADGNITDDSRIVASIPTIEYVISHGGKAILMSHLGRPKGKQPEFSLAPCAKKLSELLKKPVTLASDTIGPEVEELVNRMKPGDVVLLENVRFYKGEEKPDEDLKFVASLAKLGDAYVNDAFGSAHRAHASTATICKYFPKKSAAGFLLEKEINFLGKSLLEPKRPFYAIIGGAKISTKIGVLRSLISKVDALFIGGGMAYTFFKAQGIPIGNSLCENDLISEAKEILKICKEKNIPLHLPLDTVGVTKLENNAPSKVFETSTGINDNYSGVDIGEKTINTWKSLLQKAKTIFWNGPLGVFELPNFAKGTFAIATCLAELNDVTTIIGGGDSALAIQQAGCLDKVTHISTGGGASLEYIEQGSLPGIEALTNAVN